MFAHRVTSLGFCKLGQFSANVPLYTTTVDFESCSQALTEVQTFRFTLWGLTALTLFLYTIPYFEKHKIKDNFNSIKTVFSRWLKILCSLKFMDTQIQPCLTQMDHQILFSLFTAALFSCCLFVDVF